MKLTEFFGGSDIQRSLNLADNKCINLYPTTNDRGDVTGFLTTPGLLQYVGIPGGEIASGIYTASNGRCFMIANTTLYEITTGGILTNRGTLTAASVTRMSDNGIELIIVNGTNGWLFTFATNALEQIKVLSGTCTISNATPAVITMAGIGNTLAVGDRFRLSTTGTLPTGFSTSTTYYVIAAGFGTNTIEASLTSGGAAINTTGAGSGTHTLTSLGFGFPNGAKTVSYLNGRFVACEPGTQNFYCSEPLDGGWWDVLNVQTADSNPDLIIGEIVSHNELIVFCAQSGEAFYDSGVLPSPFVRNVSGVFEVGCIAPYSIAKIDNSVMWLGKSSTGQGVIYRLNGYTPNRLSTYSIEYSIQQMTDITDAIAFAYQQEGHHFYVITFPTGGKTFCYDVNTNLWHERASLSLGAFTRWEAQEYAYFDGKHLVCDRTEGKIYSLSLDTYTDGGSVHKWLRSFRAPPSDMKRAVHHKLTLEAEVGTGLTNGTEAQVMMRFSNDGGHTWSAENWRSMGALGQYAKRVFWNRLGMTSGAPRLYEFSGTTATKTSLLSAYLE